MKNSKKQHRSKASKKRHAALENLPRIHGTPFISSSEVSNYPQINEMVYSFRVGDLGSKSEAGLLAIALASYIVSIKQRMAGGEQLKRNIFLQFGYSYRSVSQWAKKKELHASGGTNLSPMDLVLPDASDTEQLVFSIENSIRETVAQLNEASEKNIRTVHLTAEETDEAQEPTSAFGVPQKVLDPDFRIESVVSYSAPEGVS